jgi:hypothetical protein
VRGSEAYKGIVVMTTYERRVSSLRRTLIGYLIAAPVVLVALYFLLLVLVTLVDSTIGKEVRL